MPGSGARRLPSWPELAGGRAQDALECAVHRLDGAESAGACDVLERGIARLDPAKGSLDEGRRCGSGLVAERPAEGSQTHSTATGECWYRQVGIGMCGDQCHHIAKWLADGPPNLELALICDNPAGRWTNMTISRATVR
jgi:hypothetical protein